MLDLMLPVMGAWQFRSERSGDAQIADILVVIFSANPKIAQNAELLGAPAMIHKPPSSSRL